MQNRWGIELRRGLQVTCHHPRGGKFSGAIAGFARMPGYGWRVKLDSGATAGIDDVCEAHHVIVMLRPMRHEVGAPRNRKPGYRWATRYVVVKPDGIEEFPPVTRTEAYARARELGATQINIMQGA